MHIRCRIYIQCGKDINGAWVTKFTWLSLLVNAKECFLESKIKIKRNKYMALGTQFDSSAIVGI